MLCPEVWTFPAPQVNTSYQMGNFDVKAKQIVNKMVKNQPFNSMISVVLGGCDTIPLSLQQLIDISDYYLVRNLKLSSIVRRDFIEAFVRRGSLTGISSQDEVVNSCQNVFAITPDGKLKLLISKDLYHILGLEGRLLKSSRGSLEYFEITIDLKNSELCQQSKRYERIKTALANPEVNSFDFKLTWQPDDNEICPSSIAKFFHDCEYKVEQHSLRILTSNIRDLQLPIEFLDNPGLNAADLASELAEYLATFLLECDRNAIKKAHITEPIFNLGSNGQPLHSAVILHCKGLVSSDFILKFMETARLHNDCASVVFNVNSCEKSSVPESQRHITFMLSGTKYFLYKT